MKKLTTYPLQLCILFTCILLFSLSSCSDDKDTPSPTPKLESFSFNPKNNANIESEIKGKIDGQKVEMTVPYNVSLTSLVASFSYEGESVYIGNIEQTSGVTKNDFTKPLLYKIISGDQSVEYTVTVTQQEKPAVKPYLYSFVFDIELNEGLEESAVAVINGAKIDVQVPLTVSLESIIASFKFNGDSILVNNEKQTDGVTANNFSNPVKYTVYSGKETAEYTVTVTHLGPRIPRVYIDTENKAPILNKDNYVTSTVRVEDYDKQYTDGTSFSSAAGVKGRGNSTWGMPKKPYRIKLDKKASLLGLSPDKDWALLANYTDKTLLRNITAFEISRIVGMEWTPTSLSVDFYLNGTYQGVYCLTEHVKVAKDRLDLNLVTPSDNSGEALTGDYFLELDFHADEENLFKTKLEELPIMFKDPEDPTSEQFKYVEDFFNTAESVLYSENFKDPENGYKKYIDMESFIQYYIVQELAKNVDGNMRGSCYLALRRNGKIEQPLVWDFDIAFGNAEHIVSQQGATSVGWDGWYIKTKSPWFDQLFKDPAFVQRLKERWNELKPQLDELPNYIREHAAGLNDAQQKNFGSLSKGGAGWNINEIMWPNFINRGSYSAEVDYLVTFVEKRLDWLNTNINNLQ